MARASHATPVERIPWTPQQAAEYAARRDFLLLKLLSKDRRAEATARRLGLFAAVPVASAASLSTKSHKGTERTKREGHSDPKEASPEEANKTTRKPRKVSEARKGRAVRYGQAMLLLKGNIFRRWLNIVVHRNTSSPSKLPPLPSLLPPGQEQQHGQQHMDDDRAPKRPHETPVRARSEPRSPGGTTYAALVLAGLGSSSTESTPAARPAKTRSIISASERSGQG